jgi:outer membrane protein OmpA-like peptidoglycan-associated protein
MSKSFRLGIFVVGTLTILAVGIFLIGNSGYLFSPTYRLLARFDTVSGLTGGAEVRVGGIQKGIVRQIQLPTAPDGKMTVVMDLDRSTHCLIRKDSVASIHTEGLLGNKFVDITFGSDGAPPIENGAFVQSAPPLSLSNLIAKANNLLDNSGKSMESLARISTKISEGKGTIGALVNDKRVYRQLDAATAQAETGAVAFKEDMQALKHNWFFRGFFHSRGYFDSSEISRHEILHLPRSEPSMRFVYDGKEIFAKLDSAKLKHEKMLDDAGRYLQAHSFRMAVVVAYNNKEGDADQLKLLTRARAMIVRDYLVKNFSMQDARFKTMGLGENGPHDTDKYGKVEILIYKGAS